MQDWHWWYRERKWLLQSFVKKYKVEGNALDVGASTGYYSVTLLDLGLDVMSVEIDPIGVQLCKSRGLVALAGRAESLPISSISQDLVILMDVLEHVEDDMIAISEVSRVLKVGGLLFLTVPVGMELWSDHDVQAMHFRRYELNEIERILNANNIEILNYKYWNVILRPVLYVRRKYFHGNDIAAPNRLINFLLEAIVRFERIFPNCKVRGVSLKVVAQKTSTAQ
jgi:SAM-dependent methyltransferase